MGRAIDEQHDIAHHQKLSRQLTLFAKSVKAIVEGDHQGSLVYAGGDDVLALVPLHSVLACARALAQRFKNELSEFTLSEVDRDGRALSPTLSVGIAISHHIEPLSDALHLARQAERIAKDAGRNALAITLSKRSGVDRTVTGQWNKIDNRLDRFIWLHRAEAVPDGAAYELHDLALRLEGVKAEALNAEAIRILKRKRAEQGQQTMAETTFSELGQLINDPNLTIEQLADELIIAREFASATAQAGIRLEALPGARAAERPVATEPEERQ
jgi:CRISPR-associated protein Cmr2